MEKTGSAGKNAFMGVSGGSTGIVLLLYTVHKFGIDDMTPEVAAAIITFASGVGAAIAHAIGAWLEGRKRKNAEPGVTGGAPAAEPVAGA